MLEPPAPLDPESLVGTMLGSYRLTRLLGAGGMGCVFEGQHPVIGARVAIKVLDPEVAGTPAAVERFFNEARAVNLIGHRNLVRILDLGHAVGHHYAVMELLEGRSLSALLAERGPLSLAEAAPILLQCTDALQAAHEHGIVHRDVKPDNILLVAGEGPAPLVKILDFGVAKLATPAPDAARTAVGVVIGTPAYMSPEQAEGRVDRVDGRSDVYALGVVMFQMATGSVPFQEPSQVRTLMAHVAAPLPRPGAVAPGVDPAFERIIVRCLAKAPEDRFQSMRELGQALRAALDARGRPPPLPAATPPGSAGLPSCGGGGEDEPLPGAEMFQPAPARPPEPARPPPDAPLELDLPPAPPPAAAAEAPVPPTPASPAAAAAVAAVTARVRREPRRWPAWLALLVVLLAGAAAVAHRQGLLSLRGVPLLRRAQDGVRSTLIGAGPQPAPGGALAGECPAGAGPAARKGSVELQVITEPPGARVVARWGPAGCDAGRTPWRFRAPRGARVELRYRVAGRPDREAVVTADGPQTVLEALGP